MLAQLLAQYLASKPSASALVMLMAQLPTTREGAVQVSRVACTALGSLASSSALTAAKSVAEMVSTPVVSATRMMLVAGIPLAVW